MDECLNQDDKSESPSLLEWLTDRYFGYAVFVYVVVFLIVLILNHT